MFKNLIFLLSFSFSIGIFSQNINQDLILYYSFENSLNDLSGNNYHATNFGASFTTDRFGNSNSAIIFDGIDDYLSLPNIMELKPDLPVSFSFWIKYDNLSTEDTDLFNTSFEEDKNSGVYFTLQSSTGNYAIGYGDGSDNYAPSSRRSYLANQSAIANQWNHVVIVINSSTDMKIYINCEDNGGTYSGTGGSLYYSPFSGNIGRHDRNNTSSANYFKGALDDFKYWSRALSLEEISTEYCEGTLSDNNLVVLKKVKPRLFPNPTNGILNIRSGSDVIDKLLIYDLQGKLLLDTKFNSTLNISHFSSGIYLVKMITKTNIYSERVILEK